MDEAVSNQARLFRIAPAVMAGLAVLLAVLTVVGVLRAPILEFVGPRYLASQGLPGVSFTVSRFDEATITLDNLVLGPDVTVGSLTLSYRLDEVLDGHLRGLVASQLTVDTSSMDQGFLGFVSAKVVNKATEAGDPPSPMPTLPAIRLEDARIRLRQSGMEAHASLSGDWAPDLSGNAAAEFAVSMKTPAGQLLRLRGVNAILQIAPRAETITAAFSGGTVEDPGTGINLGAVEIDGNVEYADGWVEADIGASAAGDRLRLTAEVVHEIAANRGKGRFRLPLTLFSKSGLAASDLPLLHGYVDGLEGVVGGEVIASWTPTDVSGSGEFVADRLSAGVAGTRATDATAAARVEFSTAGDRTKVTFDLDRMDLEVAGIPLMVGTLGGTLSTNTALDEARLELTGGSVEHASHRPWFSPLHLAGEVTRMGDVLRFRFDVNSAGAAVTVPVVGHHDLGAKTGSATARLPRLELRENGLQPSALSRFAALPGPVEGVLAGDVSLQWSLRSISGGGGFSFSGFEYSHPAVSLQGVSGRLETRIGDTVTAQITDTGGSVVVRDVPIEFSGMTGSGAFDIERWSGKASMRVDKLSQWGAKPWFRPLSFDGDAVFLDRSVRFETRLRLCGKPLSLQANGRHDVVGGSGHVSVRTGILTFGDDALKPADITAYADPFERFTGTIESAADLHWKDGGIDGLAELHLDDLSLETDIVAIDGLDGRLRIDGLNPLTISKPQTLRVRQLRTALPLSDAMLRFRVAQTPGRDEAVLHLDRVEAGIAGGRAVISDARIATASAETSLDVALSDVDLGRIMEIIDVEGISATGRLTGRFPLRYRGGSVFIDHGNLATTAPGILRVRSEQVRETLAGGGEQVTLLLDVLEDFHYDELSLGVDKTSEGSDRVTLRTSGSNPAVKDGHPFVLNINLSTNLEKLTAILLEGYRLSEGALRTTLGLRGNR